MLSISDTIVIPRSEIQLSFSRSPGPGGQNVNKVNSKVTLRWDIRNTTSLPWAVKQRFLARFGNRITKEGHLVLTSHRYRDQPRNESSDPKPATENGSIKNVDGPRKNQGVETYALTTDGSF